MRKSLSLAVLLLAMGLIATSCDLFGSLDVDIEGVVAVTKTVSAGVAGAPGVQPGQAPSGAAAAGLAPGQMVSFTPGSMRIALRGMYLCPQLVGSGWDRTCDNSVPDIELVGEREIELIGQQAYRDLAVFSTQSVGQGAAGEHSGALLLHSGEVHVSGTVQIGGTAYALDHFVQLETTGLPLDLPTPVNVADGVSATVQAIFDAEDVTYLYRPPSEMNDGGPWGCAEVDAATRTSVCVTNLPLLPFVGSADPTLEEYDVTLPAAFGDPDLYRLKVTVLFDPEGRLVAAAWYVIHLEGYDLQDQWFEPCMLDVASIVEHADGTYTFRTTPDTEFCWPETQLSFEFFELDDHTGTFVYGGTPYSYTATKR